MANDWPHIRVEKVQINAHCDGGCGMKLDPDDLALHIEDIDTLIFICKKCLFNFTQEAGG